MRWPRTVVEHMAEMRVGGLRSHFGALHAEGAIGFLDDLGGFHRPRETRPAGAGIKFVQRTEQWLAGNDVHVNAGFVIVPKIVSERWFGSRMLGHFELKRSQLPLKQKLFQQLQRREPRPLQLHLDYSSLSLLTAIHEKLNNMWQIPQPVQIVQILTRFDYTIPAKSWQIKR